MTDRIEPKGWMKAPATEAVMDALTAAGAEFRFVGGCVRDTLLGRTVQDIDIVTNLPPDRVMKAMTAAAIKVVPTGLDHGTVTAVAQDRPFEITTLRRDVETYGRHAKVAFTDDWAADAARRDFTINALYVSRDGEVFDPFHGIDDLRRGRVRFVGEARRRIAEDVLRLLRFFRFHAHFGRGAPDPDGLEACREMAPQLTSLSAERVRAEVLKLLSAPDPAPLLQIMQEAGILQVVLPEVGGVDRLRRLTHLEQRVGRRLPDIVAKDPVRRLALLIDVNVAEAQAVAARLRLSNRDRDRLSRISAALIEVEQLPDREEARRMLYRQGKEAFVDAVLAHAADVGEAEEGAVETTLAVAVNEPPPRFPLSGRDVKSAGIASGPAVGKLLAEIEEWWIAKDFAPGREECLARLRQRIAKYEPSEGP